MTASTRPIPVVDFYSQQRDPQRYGPNELAPLHRFGFTRQLYRTHPSIDSPTATGLVEYADTHSEQLWDLGPHHTFSITVDSHGEPGCRFPDRLSTLPSVANTDPDEYHLESPMRVVLDTNTLVHYLALAWPFFEPCLGMHGVTHFILALVGSTFKNWLCLAAEDNLSRPMFQGENIGDFGSEEFWRRPLTEFNWLAWAESRDIETSFSADRVRVPMEAVGIRKGYSREDPEWTPEAYRAHLAVENFYELGDADPNCSE